MRYEKLGRGDLKVSVVGFGAWAIGGRQWGAVDDDESIRAIERALELGVNFFDTADVYGLGHSEELLGTALSAAPQAIVATKVGLGWNGKGKIRHDLSPGYIKTACEASLRRLNREAIDLYQIHWPDPGTPLADTIGALADLVSAGKVRFVGGANLPIAAIKELSAYPWFISYQGIFNLIDRTPEAPARAFCRDHEIGFIAYEPLAKGLLTGKFTEPPIFGRGDHRKYEARFTSEFSDYRLKIEALSRAARGYNMTAAQLALAWLLENGATAVIPGIKTAAQIEENVAAADRDGRDYGRDI